MGRWRIMVPRLAAAIAVSVLLVAGCNDPDTGSVTGEEPAAPERTAEVSPGRASTIDAVPSVVEAVEPAVVSVIATGGEGSGVVYRDDGIVVTNHHVVAGSDQVEVVFADGGRSAGTVADSDERTDLAVVEVDRRDLPVATFADTLPRVGELAVAVGNPLGFERTVTAGIVSGLGRSVPAPGPRQAALVDLIQTDAAISPGSSGGALANADGEIMGINIAYIPPQLGAVSVGFAIPAPTVVQIVDQLLTGGGVSHPFLGVQVVDISASLARQFDLGATEGALVTDVSPDTPADEAGLDLRDVIVGIDERPVASSGDFLAALRQYEPGDEIRVHVRRGGEEVELVATLVERPD
jgi:S1-C subfamily serine protease